MKRPLPRAASLRSSTPGASAWAITDEALRRLSGADTLPEHQRAVYKMVDTCGAEFDAETPYFYSTWDTVCESRAFPRSGKPVIMVLGSGPIRIGQGIEFDYSSVHCVWTLKKLGYDVVIVNNNPETVSTDYDTADRLYFEPLCPEDVMDIIDAEKPVGVVVAFGGQTAIKLTKFLDEHGIPILGTSAESIDMAEDRERFDALLEQFHIKRPRGCGVTGMQGALDAAHELGYPVLLRPSYVIGGQNMVIAHNDEEVRRYMERHPLRQDRKPRAGGPVPDGQGAGGGRDLRRHRRAHPRHHAAHRAHRRSLRRLHRRLSRPSPSPTGCAGPSSTAPRSWPCP